MMMKIIMIMKMMILLLKAFVNLIESFGWKSFTILYEDNQVDLMIMMGMMMTMRVIMRMIMRIIMRMIMRIIMRIIMRMMMMILAIMMARAISYRWMHFTAFLRFPLEGASKFVGANKFAPKIVLALRWHCGSN